MTLYLVRHARTRWSGVRYCGRTDLPLCDEGLAEARAAAAWLGARGGRPSRIVSSPRARAMESARLVAAPWERAVETDARLREADFGDAEGLTFAELERGWPDLARRLAVDDLDIDWPHGERARDLSARVAEFWRERTESDTSEEDLVVVTHGGPARHLMTLAGAASPAALVPAEIVVLERAVAESPAVLAPAQIVAHERMATASHAALAPAEIVVLERVPEWRVVARWRPSGSERGMEVSR